MIESQFPWISKISGPTPAETLDLAKKYGATSYPRLPVALRALTDTVVLPQGLIRGALATLGVSCLVKAEIKPFPVCTWIAILLLFSDRIGTFTIKINQ